MPPPSVDFSSLEFLRERKAFGCMKHCWGVGFKHGYGIIRWSSWTMEGIYSNVDSEESVAVIILVKGTVSICL